MPVGLFFTLVSAFVTPITLIVWKKAQECQAHFSVINLYASYFGMPLTFFLASSLVLTGASTTDYSGELKPSFYWSLFYTVLSAFLGMLFGI